MRNNIALELILGYGMLLLVGELIATVILRAAAKWVEKRDIPFGSAFLTTLIATGTNLILTFVVGLIVGSITSSKGLQDGVNLFMLPVGFCIQAGIISARLKIAYRRACLVWLTMIAITIGILVFVAGLSYLVLKLNSEG